ncbi:MAG TPA: hypothetical protein VFX02_11530 [Gammaproteobacteria bacterium]|nr:hypothetical protein [Gammaproteobacteria bacterium]
MKTRNPWVRHLRFKLLAVLCVVLLGQGVFIHPALADTDTDPEVDARYAVITRGAGKLDCFMVHGGEIWRKSYNGSWTDWSNLGRAPTGEDFTKVAAVAAGNNRWDIFATSNTTNVVYHLAFDGTYLWSWESMGSVGNVAFAGVQAVSSGNGQITLLTRTTYASAAGSSPFVYKTWTASNGWRPSQTGWTTLDNTGSRFSVYALAHSGSQLGFFRQMHSTALGYKSWNGTRWMQVDRNGLWFNQWADLSGGLSYKTPYAVSWGPNRVDVFARGTDGNAYINSTDSASNGGGWYGWASLGKVSPYFSGQAYTGAITAVAWGPNRLDIFTREESTYYYKAWTGTQWWPSQTTWENIGTIPGDYTWNYSPNPVSWGPNRIDLFTFDSNLGTSGTLYHKYTDGNGWFPTGGNGWESLGHPPI